MKDTGEHPIQGIPCPRNAGLETAADETDRPLSERVLADLRFAKLLEHHDELATAGGLGKNLAGQSNYKEKCSKSNSKKIMDTNEGMMNTVTGTDAASPTMDISHAGSEETILTGITEAQRIMDEIEGAGFFKDINDALNFVDNEEDDDDMLGAATEQVTIRAAADSGAVANTIHPKDLPSDAVVEPNTSGRHFVGANNARIEKYGTCTTKLESEHGAVGCNWNVADVARPLHSISTITGPEFGPAKQDVLFTNRKCVVVPPGIVEEVLKRIRPVSEYTRTGNLYLGEFKMSSFTRQGLEA